MHGQSTLTGFYEKKQVQNWKKTVEKIEKESFNLEEFDSSLLSEVIVPELLIGWDKLYSLEKKRLGKLRSEFFGFKQRIVESICPPSEEKANDFSVIKSLTTANFKAILADFALSVPITVADLILSPNENTYQFSKKTLVKKLKKLFETASQQNISYSTDKFLVTCLNNAYLNKKGSLLFEEILGNLNVSEEVLACLPFRKEKKSIFSPASNHSYTYEEAQNVRNELSGLLNFHSESKTAKKTAPNSLKSSLQDDNSDMFTRNSSSELKLSLERSNSRLSSNSLTFFSSSKMPKKTVKKQTTLSRKRKREETQFSSLLKEEQVSNFSEFLKTEKPGKENSETVLLGKSPCDLRSKKSFYKKVSGTNLMTKFEEATNLKSLF